MTQMIALQTAAALNRIGLVQGMTVYTEGGFRENRDYNAILAVLCPSASFRLSGMAKATSFGAARHWAQAVDSCASTDVYFMHTEATLCGQR